MTFCYNFVCYIHAIIHINHLHYMMWFKQPKMGMSLYTATSVILISLSAAVLAPWLDFFSKLSVMTNPDPELPSTVLETLVYIFQVASRSYHGGTLEDVCRAVLDNLGLWIPQVPI